jgi:hypothetical protein
MKIIKEATEDEMVLAFLRAELHSDRWKDKVGKILLKYDVESKLIDEADLHNKTENKLRLKVLGDLRGYRRNTKLFKDFPKPKEVKWFRARLQRKELGKVKYINYSYWNQLTGGSGLVVDGVKTIKKGIEVLEVGNDQYIKLADHVNKGGKFPEIILIGKNEGKELSVVEGHVRITSFLLAEESPDNLEVIVGFV